MSGSSWASEAGINALGKILEAQDVWRSLTKAQRAALLLPADKCHPKTYDTLKTRGLLEGMHLTQWGEFVVKVKP